MKSMYVTALERVHFLVHNRKKKGGGEIRLLSGTRGKHS